MCEVDLKKKKLIMSEDLDFCENCGEWKHVVVKICDKNPVKRWLRKMKQQLIGY